MHCILQYLSLEKYLFVTLAVRGHFHLSGHLRWMEYGTLCIYSSVFNQGLVTSGDFCTEHDFQIHTQTQQDMSECSSAHT